MQGVVFKCDRLDDNIVIFQSFESKSGNVR